MRKQRLILIRPAHILVFDLITKRQAKQQKLRDPKYIHSYDGGNIYDSNPTL